MLPTINTREDYRRIYRDADVWLPAMRAICQRHGLDAAKLEFAPPGTHVVFQVEGLYLKLFSPLWGEDFVPERLVLRQLSGRSDLPVPQLVAEGEIENWAYIIVTAVDGVPLNQVWDSMEASNRTHMAARCGELMASLHSTQTKGLEAISVDWSVFVESQIQNCIDHLGRADLDKQWIQSILAFLDDLPPLFEPDFRPVLLSADVTDEHILVSQRGGRWELAGFIDFGDAMLGHPYYEFVAPGCCITRGSSDLQRAMLLAYGYSKNQLDATLAKQLMAYTFVHRFFSISDLLGLFGPQRPADFDALKKALWSFEYRGKKPY
ncbi:MAG: phosphotransferase [Chloroflexi bacterium]|nr:phosphotransferase [Chloroflexota bacterium]